MGSDPFSALVDGDRDIILRINHSSEMEFPTSYLMEKISPMFQQAGMSNIAMTAIDDRHVDVRMGDQSLRFEFLKEKNGYFFVNIKG